MTAIIGITDSEMENHFNNETTAEHSAMINLYCVLYFTTEHFWISIQMIFDKLNDGLISKDVMNYKCLINDKFLALE